MPSQPSKMGPSWETVFALGMNRASSLSRYSAILQLLRLNMATGKKAAHDASKILHDKKSSKTAKEVAASDLAQVKKATPKKKK
jgi:hypothetical protein